MAVEEQRGEGRDREGDRIREGRGEEERKGRVKGFNKGWIEKEGDRK